MNFDKWAEHARQFVKEIAKEMGHSDEARAGRALRIVVHVLRERLGVEDGLHLVAQLPMFIKAIYLDGWRPAQGGVRRIKDIDDFVDAMYEEDARSATRDFPDRELASKAAQAVFAVVKRHVSRPEADKLAGTLPRQLRRFWMAA